MYHDKASVREVLNGDVSSLMMAFKWKGSPQGGQHWIDIIANRKKLSKRSRQYLNKLLNS